MKIAHLVLSLNRGGMENGIVNVTSRLPISSFQTRILCIREKGSMADRLPDTCLVDCLNYPSGFHLLGVWKIVQYLKKHNISILYTHNAASLTWGGLAAQLCPQTVWIHGEHGYPKGIKRLKPLQQWLITRAACITAVSKNLVNETKESYNRQDLDINVISNGVDTARFQCATADQKRLLRTELNIPDDAFVLIVVGRLESRKNQQFAVKVLAELRQKGCNQVRLIFVGEGPDESKLRALTQQNQLEANIDFLGFRDDIPKLLRCANLLLLPSSHGEGMANVILEANASGLPVIASSIPGNTDLIENDFNGHLLPVDVTDSTQQWSDKISTYLANWHEQETFRQNARAHVKAHFSMDKMISNYAQLYRNLAPVAFPTHS